MYSVCLSQILTRTISSSQILLSDAFTTGGTILQHGVQVKWHLSYFLVKFSECPYILQAGKLIYLSWADPSFNCSAISGAYSIPKWPWLILAYPKLLGSHWSTPYLLLNCHIVWCWTLTLYSLTLYSHCLFIASGTPSWSCWQVRQEDVPPKKVPLYSHF